MVRVVEYLKVLERVVKEAVGLAFDVQLGVRVRRPAELRLHLFVVVAVDVTVATGPDKVADIQVALLRHHVREQCVAGDIEGHTQENISAALVQLTA